MEDVSSKKIFDIHSHLQISDYDDDREEVIEKMQKENIFSIVVGVDFKSSEKAVLLSEKYENIFATVGMHPNDNQDEEFNFDKYKKLAENKKVVAIGECGIDYYRNKKINHDEAVVEKERQKELFKNQIKIALELNLPLMIHIRNNIVKEKNMDAHSDAIEILSQYKKEHGKKLRGNIHFFSGTQIEAEKYFDLDFTISFTGVITFSDDYDNVIKNSPIEMIMAETDSPFVSPASNRGKRNEPKYIKEIIKKISKIKNIDEEKVINIMSNNVKRVFGIS